MNAVAHRNYQLPGYILIRQYPNVLRIESPGGFPSGVTAKNVLDSSSPRNRLIAEILELAGLVERAGQGVNLMFELSVREAKALPDFSRSDESSVRLDLNGLLIDPALLRMVQKIEDENGLINKANGLSFEEYKQWLINKQIESEQKGLVDGWKVPSTTYWLYIDNVPVGFGNVREFLTDALRIAGGNIGYGIAKPYRGKGYGKELLKLLLGKAKEKGIDKVLITIHKDNEASRAVAESNGAILEAEKEDRAYYWIESAL